MGEVAEMQVAPKPVLAAGSRPRAIVPTDIDQVWRMAEIVFKSGLAPHDLDTKEKITVALLHGLEIGLPPMLALNKIAIVNGRPSVWGDAVPGIALGTGLLEDWQERLDGESDLMVATCTVKRKGVKTPKTQTFSVADAKRAGLWDERQKIKRRNKKTGEFFEGENDSPWHRYPKRMLAMRARVAFRDLFADAFGGMLIAEELIGTQEPIAAAETPAQAPLPMIEAPTPAGALVGEIVPRESAEAIDVSTSGRPLPPLIHKANPSPSSNGDAPQPVFTLATLKASLSAAQNLDEANAAFDNWIAKRTEEEPLTQDEEDEADAVMREVGAKFWRSEDAG